MDLILGTTLIICFLWFLLSLNTSRNDGKLVKNVHPYRRMLHYILDRKSESTVYFDEYINVEELLRYLKEIEPNYKIDITHCLVAGCAIALKKNPLMNRFVAGRRLYQRNDDYVTFSMKKKRHNKKAKLTAVKLKVTDEMTFRSFCKQINDMISVERSEKKTYTDKELDLLTLLPRPLLYLAVKFCALLNEFNLLPAAFIKNDAMFTSMFIANLGSIGMKAGYHHLYEWGTCPHFIMAGGIQERPTLKDGQYSPQKTLHLRFTYDERIEDGLNAGEGIKMIKTVLENPYTYLGCLEENPEQHQKLGASL